MKTADPITLLMQINVFADVSREDLLLWRREGKLTIKQFFNKEIVHLQNEPCHGMDIILWGKVSIQSIDERGNVLTIDTLSDGSIIGSNLVFATNCRYPMTITCIEACRIASLDRELILELCQRSRNFLELFLSVLSQKTLTIIDRLKKMAHKTIRDILVDFLLYEYYKQNSLKILLHTSKKDLAERFGIQRPSLSRELNKMQKDGLIAFDSKSITIHDLDRLRSARR